MTSFIASKKNPEIIPVTPKPSVTPVLPEFIPGSSEDKPISIEPEIAPLWNPELFPIKDFFFI